MDYGILLTWRVSSLRGHTLRQCQTGRKVFIRRPWHNICIWKVTALAVLALQRLCVVIVIRFEDQDVVQILREKFLRMFLNFATTVTVGSHSWNG